MSRIRKDSKNRLVIGVDKRRIHKNQTAFLLVVAFGSVLLFMTSRMIKNERRGVKYSVKLPRELNVFKYNSNERKYIKDIQPSFKTTENVGLKKLANIDLVKLNNHRTLLSNKENPTLQCEEPLDLVILIFSKTSMTELRNTIRKTWCKKKIFNNDQKMTCLFLIGQAEPGQHFEKLDDEITEHGDVIMTPYTYSRRNSSLILFEGLKWLMNNCMDVKYVLRTEDDVIINIEHLMNHILPGIPKKNFVGGKCESKSANRNPESSFYISFDDYENDKLPVTCLNLGYVMSGDVASLLHKTSKTRTIIPLDDVFTGILLHENNVTPQSLDQFLLTKSVQNFDINHCNYAVVHLHLNTEEKHREIWPKMRSICNKS